MDELESILKELRDKIIIANCIHAISVQETVTKVDKLIYELDCAIKVRDLENDKQNRMTSEDFLQMMDYKL